MHTAKTRTLPILFAILSIFMAAPASAGEGPSIKAIDDYFAAFTEANRIPGLSVAVVEDGAVIFCRGYGSDGLGGAMATDTRLCIGSVSKTFTALAILQLAERGAIDLDAPIKRYVPWFSVKGPGSERITVRHLLTHTSGLDERGDPHPELANASPEDELRSLADVRPSAAPGTRFAYYNKNYRALGYLVEKASGLSYGEYLRRNVFEPLGMSAASADPSGIARGSAPFFGLSVGVPNTYYSGDAPAGGLVMSASDAAKYLAALMGSHSARIAGAKVASADLVSRLREVPAGIGSQYGLGWSVERGGERLTHGGDVSGFHAYAEMNLDAKTGCIVLCRENGLMPMLSCYDELPIAVHGLLAGEAVSDPRAFVWIAPATVALAILVVLYHAWRFARQPAWLRKAERRAPFVRVLMLIPGPLLSAFFLCLPWLFSALLGLACTWADLFHFLPDMALLVVLSSSASILRAFLRARGLVIRRGIR
jgi:Beta-lactamase class C and other penicillin binding proteins